MNRYRVKLSSMAKLAIGPTGVVRPLCDNCINEECGNPIEIVDISVFGVQQNMKLYRSGSNLMAVSQCEGHMSSNYNQDTEDY